jgi:hypothetical protein
LLFLFDCNINLKVKDKIKKLSIIKPAEKIMPKFYHSAENIMYLKILCIWKYYTFENIIQKSFLKLNDNEEFIKLSWYHVL